MTDEAGIIAHARLLASEFGPGDPAATLLAMATQAERLMQERTGLRVACRNTEAAAENNAAWFMAARARAEAAEAENARLCGENAELRSEYRSLYAAWRAAVLDRDRWRALSLRLRDAWRAGRGEAERAAWLERVAAKVVSYLNGHERTYETALWDVLQEEPKP